MFELLNMSPGSAKAPIIPKPTELLGNYEVITIPQGPAGRFQHATWVRGDEMFVAGGSGSGVSGFADVWGLDLNTKVWKQYPNLPQAVVGIDAAYGPVADLALISPGYVASSNSYLNVGYKFDHKAGTWATYNMNGAYSLGGAYTSYCIRREDTTSPLIHATGGFYNSGGIKYLNSMNTMRLSDQVWNNPIYNFYPTASTPTPSNLGTTMIDNSVMYIRDGALMYSFNLLFDVSPTLQSTNATFDPLNSKHMFEFGGNVYFIARIDISGDPPGSRLVKYNVTTKVWSYFDPLPGIGTQLPGVVYWNGALWVWSGMDMNNNSNYPNQLIRVT